MVNWTRKSADIRLNSCPKKPRLPGAVFLCPKLSVGFDRPLPILDRDQVYRLDSNLYFIIATSRDDLTMEQADIQPRIMRNGYCTQTTA
jgi:hypothetical protein